MPNKLIDREMQCSNWTTENNLSQEATDYGACGVYVIWYIIHIVDQRLRALEVPRFLVQLSTGKAGDQLSWGGRPCAM